MTTIVAVFQVSQVKIAKLKKGVKRFERDGKPYCQINFNSKLNRLFFYLRAENKLLFTLFRY